MMHIKYSMWTRVIAFQTTPGVWVNLLCVYSYDALYVPRILVLLLGFAASSCGSVADVATDVRLCTLYNVKKKESEVGIHRACG